MLSENAEHLQRWLIENGALLRAAKIDHKADDAAVDVAIRLLNALTRTNLTPTSTLDTSIPQPGAAGWIKVEPGGQLPREGEAVLLSVQEFNLVATLVCVSDGFGVEHPNCWTLRYLSPCLSDGRLKIMAGTHPHLPLTWATHWRPLPEPPKE